MASKTDAQTTETESSSKKFNPAKALEKLKASTGMCSFSESKYTEPEDYLDTGCKAFNRIMSGDTKKGFPTGYITLVVGPSQSGKSYYSARAIISAKKKKYKAIFVFDTEGGSVTGLILESGEGLDNVFQILTPNAEQAIIDMQKVFDYITEYQSHDPSARFLIVFDSIGGLRSKKLAEDASAGKQVADVGATAKKIGDLITLMTIPCLKTHTAAILLSHTYTSIGQMMPSKVSDFFGGNKAKYMPSICVECRSVNRKSDKMTGTTDDDTFFQGSEFVFFTFKNRFIKPFFEARTLNNFISGEDKYFGLFDVAVGYGLIVQSSSMYSIPVYSGEKKWYSKDILNGPESEAIWEKLIPEIDRISAEDMKYGGKTFTDTSVTENMFKNNVESESTDHMQLA